MPNAAIYRLLTTLAEPGLRALLQRRLAQGKEDAERIGERLGEAALPRPQGRLLWLHAASVGEALSVLALIERLRARTGSAVLVTTGTVSSARLMAERLPQGCLHHYAPIDRPAWVGRFLDHWRPDLGLWVESELWPNLVLESRRRGIPLALVNGRLSARSVGRWRWSPRLIGAVLDCFEPCLAQDEDQAARLAALGARRVRSVGNLKFSTPPLPANFRELERLRGQIGARPVWLAASTHSGEETLVASVHRRLSERWPGLLTVIAPRHVSRAPAILRELEMLSVAQRSAGQPVRADTGIYLADTMGELGLFYRLSPLAFIGGSLVAVGGHNPLEACQLGALPIVGPHTGNFTAVMRRLGDAGALIAVADAPGLHQALASLLGDEGARSRHAAAAAAVLAEEAGALDRVMAALEPLLAAATSPQSAPRHARA